MSIAATGEARRGGRDDAGAGTRRRAGVGVMGDHDIDVSCTVAEWEVGLGDNDGGERWCVVHYGVQRMSFPASEIDRLLAALKGAAKAEAEW
jgi:hypothetical protein